MDKDSLSDISSSSAGCSDLPKLDYWEPNFPSYNHNDKPPAIYNRSIKPFAMMIISSRNQGKSVMLRHLYEEHFEGRFDLVIVFSNTLGNGWYDEFLQCKTKYNQYDEDVLINLLNIQQEHKAEYGKYLNVLTIFDDCVSEEIKNSEPLQNLFLMGRHMAISIVFITQSPTLAKTVWRQNTTHLIVLRCKGKGKEHIINGFLLDLVDEEDCGSMKPDAFLRKLLKSVFDERYTALVVDYDKEGNSLRDCMKLYRANTKFKRRNHKMAN